jgi:hypothetical protein
MERRRSSVDIEDYTKKKPSRKVESGRNVLDNNGVNFLMAATMSFGAMLVAGWYWNIPISSILAK